MEVAAVDAHLRPVEMDAAAVVGRIPAGAVARGVGLRHGDSLFHPWVRPVGAGLVATARPKLEMRIEIGDVEKVPGGTHDASLRQTPSRMWAASSTCCSSIVSGGTSRTTLSPAVSNTKGDFVLTNVPTGTYTLRAYADDGVLLSYADVTVTVR